MSRRKKKPFLTTDEGSSGETGRQSFLTIDRKHALDVILASAGNDPSAKGRDDMSEGKTLRARKSRRWQCVGCEGWYWKGWDYDMHNCNERHYNFQRHLEDARFLKEIENLDLCQ